MLRIFFTSFLVVNFARGDRPHTFENLLHIALVRRTLSGILHFNNWMMIWLGSNGGVVMRAIPSHQCGPGPIPRVDAIHGLSLLLVLSLAPRGFSLGTLVFPSPQKPTFPNSNSTRNQVDEEPLCGCATSKSLFIYFYYFIFWGLHDLRVQWAMSSSAQHASFKYIRNWHWFWVFITSLVEAWFKYLMMLCPLNVSL